VGEEIDEPAGGRFYGIAVGIGSVRLDGSQVPGGKNADLAIKWRYRYPTHDPARARPPRHRARPGYRRGARRILPTPLPLPGLAECRRGLFTALASWRTMAVRLARSPEERARQEAAAVLAQVPEELRPGPEQDEATRWMADPTRSHHLCHDRCHPVRAARRPSLHHRDRLLDRQHLDRGYCRNNLIRRAAESGDLCRFQLDHWLRTGTGGCFSRLAVAAGHFHRDGDSLCSAARAHQPDELRHTAIL
jgi:hypothetical protein